MVGKSKEKVCFLDVTNVDKQHIQKLCVCLTSHVNVKEWESSRCYNKLYTIIKTLHIYQKSRFDCFFYNLFQ